MQSHYEKYGRRWYEKNKDRVREQGKKWDIENRARRVEITQKYVRENREKVRGYNTGYAQSVQGKYRTYEHQAKSKGNEWNLTLEQFALILSLPCEYCGQRGGGVDRIDNTKGYSIENTAPCCKFCNYMKRDYAVEEFLAHISKIYEHQSQ